jgi:Flp pilus assembly protein TadD
VNEPPNSAERQNDLGVMLMLSGRYEESLTAIRRALEVNPAFAEAYNSLGTLYTRILQPESARDASSDAMDSAYAPLEIAVCVR